MNDTNTVDLQTGIPSIYLSATGSWDIDNTSRVEPKRNICQLLQTGGIALAMIASPVTAVPDSWFFERRRRETSTINWIYEGIIGKPISIQKARQIALHFMHEIEEERKRVAELDAKRFIYLEDIS